MPNGKSGERMKPSILVFDLGKVLVDFDYSRAGRRIAARSAMSPAEVQGFLDHSPLLFRYETGEIKRQEFFNIVRDHTKFRGTIEEFGEFFADIFSEIPQMIQLHASLQKAGVPTYIFSNTNDLAVTHIRNRFPFFSHFDGYILSYEVGAMKPSAKIYECLEAMTSRTGGEFLYIDDRKENIDAGTVRGWKTIWHQSPEDTISKVRQAGLPV
jgi:HAD superfamily hydrolase (TIGR01509 family)